MKKKSDFAEGLYFVGVPSQLRLNGQEVEGIISGPDFNNLRRLLLRFGKTGEGSIRQIEP